MAQGRAAAADSLVQGLAASAGWHRAATTAWVSTCDQSVRLLTGVRPASVISETSRSRGIARSSGKRQIPKSSAMNRVAR